MIKLLALFVGLNFFQSTDKIFRDIEISMKTASAKELVKLFNNSVELKIDGNISNYSRNQAEVVLRQFFKEHPVDGFSYIHKGSSSEGLKYAIGRYEYKKGSYRIVMFLKKSEGTYRIDTLNFTSI